MRNTGITTLLAVFTCLSVSLTAHAHDSKLSKEQLLAEYELAQGEAVLQKEELQRNCVSRLVADARGARWLAQRENIQYLETTGASFKKLTNLYRSLIQPLFDVPVSERAAVLGEVLPKNALLSGLDLRESAFDFTNDLIRMMSMLYSDEGVLQRLRKFADLRAQALAE